MDFSTLSSSTVLKSYYFIGIDAIAQDSLIIITNHIQNSIHQFSFIIPTTFTNNMPDYHLLLKFIVVGDTGVGKSCLVHQFLDMNVRQSHDVTVGVEFGTKNIEINRKEIRLQVWDTAGQENFRCITRSYYKGAIGAFLVYDTTRRSTFDHIQNWIEEVKANGNPYINFFLIGSKNDLGEKRVVSENQGYELAQKYQIPFVQTNYKDCEKIQKCFQQLAAKIILKIEKGQIPQHESNIGIKRGEKMNRVSISRIITNQNKKTCC